MEESQLTEREQTLTNQVNALKIQIEFINNIAQARGDAVDAHKTSSILLQQRIQALENIVQTERNANAAMLDRNKQLEKQLQISNQLKDNIDSKSGENITL